MKRKSWTVLALLLPLLLFPSGCGQEADADAATVQAAVGTPDSVMHPDRDVAAVTGNETGGAGAGQDNDIETSPDEEEDTPADEESEEGQEKEAGSEETRRVKECLVAVPKGFEASEEQKGLYISEHYPLDSSNIYYTVTEDGEDAPDWERLTEEAYREEMERELSGVYGSDISFEIEEFLKTETKGALTYRIKAAFDTGEHRVEQLILIIPADRTYTVTYSQAEDDGNMEAFEESASNVEIVWE